MGTNRFITGKTKFLVWATYLLGLHMVTSQNQITFRQLSVKDGLSQNSAISIAQDSTGYLWIATQDGLNKYDGREFNIHPFKFVDITKTDYSHLGKIYRDKEGGLWVIPLDKKLYKLNPQKNIFEIFPGLEDVSVLFQDETLTYWVGTYSKGVYQFDPRNGSSKKVLSGNEFNGPIYTISSDNKGTIVMATDGQLIEFDKKSQSFSHVRFKDYYGEDIIGNFSDMVTDSQGRQWISTFGDGLYFRNGSERILQRVSHLTFTDPLPANLNILDIHLDKKQRLWVATYGRGLYLLDFEKKSISHFNADKNNPRAIHYNDILCIYEDNSGTLWFGTDGGGISYYDEFLEKFNSFTNNQTPEGINIDVVRSITTDHKGAVWIGTSGKGLTQYEPGNNSWQTFTTGTASDNGITSNRIMSLLVDDDGDLWIGTQEDGLILRDTIGNFRPFNTTSKIPLSAHTVWNIFKDRNNTIWLGTRENGLIQFDKNKGVVKQLVTDPKDSNSLPSNNVRVITEDPNGKLWIGTEEDGIARYDPTLNTFERFYQDSGSNSYTNNSIKALYYSPNGMLWIGTNGGGLNALDTTEEKFYRYTTEDGLANNVIYAILPDAQGSLWLSSNRGITKFTPNPNMTTQPIVINYSNYDGLATEFNTGAYHIGKDGTLYFGGLDGFYWFRPEDIRENQILAKTSITDFGVLGKSTPMVSGTRLKYNQNTLSFSFSSLQYSLPEKNEYQYRLVNHDEDWVYSGNINMVRYAQLPPNDYIFQVKSSNYDGVWNEQPTSFAFTIAQPWYWSTWSRIVYGLLLLAAIYGIYTYLKWRLRMKLNLQLKEEEAQRLKRLNDFKSKLYTDISHEFRTPLTLISGPVDAKLAEGKLSESDYTNFSMIKRNTNRLIALVDQLLHLAKLEKGKLRLKVTNGNLGLFLGMIATSFEYKAESRNMRYEIDIEDLNDAWYDEDAVEKIVANLLSNALKYGKENGLCRFYAHKKEGKAHIGVENTVVDTLDIDFNQIFDRFYQKDEFAEGAGVGLALVKELVQLYKGEISVGLEGEDIIHFKVILPTERADFKKKDLLTSVAEKVETQTTVTIDAVDEPEASAMQQEGSDERPLVLVVEDHKEVRQFLTSVWKHRYQMYEANNGKEGIEKALQIVPDLIITDVRMPLCNGITLCNTLKTDERTSHIPIILLTAGAGEEDELLGLQSGADDFITKPFKLRPLQTRVENLIANRRALRNRYSQEVVLKAKDIAITPTDELFLNKVQKVLDDHLADPAFNAKKFASLVGMSRMQLHRKLQTYTGLSTTEFIRSQRLKQAAHILRTSDATINEVAYTVGFNTPSYFIKCFKETYKKTPAEFVQTTE